MTYKLHELCELFPPMTDMEFDALKSDIGTNGLHNPIVLHDDEILDGGNRYRACLEVGIKPDFVSFNGDLVSFVLSANLHRRHLVPGQMAAIVASATNWNKAKSHGGARNTKQVATLPLETVKSRALESGASERTQRMADRVAKADPDLAKKVAHGEISLPKAHEKIASEKKINNDYQNIEELKKIDQNDSEEIISELKRELKEALADNEMMGRVFDSDDRIKVAIDEAKRQKAIADHAELLIASKQGEFKARADQVTYWKNRAEKAEKELAKLKAVQ